MSVSLLVWIHPCSHLKSPSFLLLVEKWQGRNKVTGVAERLFWFVSVLDLISFGKTDGSGGTNSGSGFVGKPWGCWAFSCAADSFRKAQIQRSHSMAPVHQSVPQTSTVSPLSKIVSSEAAAGGRCSPIEDDWVCSWQKERAVLTLDMLRPPLFPVPLTCNLLTLSVHNTLNSRVAFNAPGRFAAAATVVFGRHPQHLHIKCMWMTMVLFAALFWWILKKDILIMTERKRKRGRSSLCRSFGQVRSNWHAINYH